MKFVASKEGKAIQEKMPVVGNKGGEQMQALVQQAAAKALADVQLRLARADRRAAPAVPVAGATPPGAVPALPN